MQTVREVGTPAARIQVYCTTQAGIAAPRPDTRRSRSAAHRVRRIPGVRSAIPCKALQRLAEKAYARMRRQRSPAWCFGHVERVGDQADEESEDGGVRSSAY